MKGVKETIADGEANHTTDEKGKSKKADGKSQHKINGQKADDGKRQCYWARRRKQLLQKTENQHKSCKVPIFIGDKSIETTADDHY